MTERTLLLARHPETTANVEGRWVGSGDAPFTPHGELQAAALVSEIVAFRPQVVVSSPLRRAYEPARLSADALGVEHVLDDRLVELDFGVAEGLTFDEARERGIAFEFASRSTPVAADGESRDDIFGRSAAAADDVLERYDRSVLVTHGGVFRSVLVHVLGLPFDAIWTFHIRNAAVAELQVGDDYPGPGGWARLEEFRQVRA